jgi:1,4-alpha-glucan branching enzyme
VDQHLITEAKPLGTFDRGRYEPVNEAQLHWDSRRGWKSVLEPVGVSSRGDVPRCFAFGRHPRVSEQVWSGSIGYPGNGVYLEFHKKHASGLRYWKVTNNKLGLGDKDMYYPDDIPGRIHEHSVHFCNVVKEVLREHRDRTGRKGVCVAPFDAELFGHWWFEGPKFLRDVVLTAAHDSDIELATAEEALNATLPDKVMRLPEGSWGEHGDHSVWINDSTRWMWEIEYRAEDNMLKMLHHLPWQTNAQVRKVLERAGRQLLLLQASDWPFVIHSKGAVDYGIQRFAGHATNFNRLVDMADEAARGIPLDALREIELAEMDGHDTIFENIDLNWWK